MKIKRGAPYVEQLNYAPGVKDTTDLEVATKTITATAEGAALGNADYSASLTIPAPSDARLVVTRIATRLAVTIDSISTGGITLNCRVYVDVKDAAHLLFDTGWTTSGAKLAVQDVLTGTLDTIFNLLKDGGAHTFYFFFWKSAAGTGNTVLSVAELWEGVGSSTTGYGAGRCLQINHSGFLSSYDLFEKTGAGAMRSHRMAFTGQIYWYNFSSSGEMGVTAVVQNPQLAIDGDTATDIWTLSQFFAVLQTQ